MLLDCQGLGAEMQLRWRAGKHDAAFVVEVYGFVVGSFAAGVAAVVVVAAAAEA